MFSRKQKGLKEMISNITILDSNKENEEFAESCIQDFKRSPLVKQMGVPRTCPKIQKKLPFTEISMINNEKQDEFKDFRSFLTNKTAQKQSESKKTENLPKAKDWIPKIEGIDENTKKRINHTKPTETLKVKRKNLKKVKNADISVITKGNEMENDTNSIFSEFKNKLISKIQKSYRAYLLRKTILTRASAKKVKKT